MRLVVTLLILEGLHLVPAATAAPPSPAAASVMALEGKYPDMDTALKLMKNNFFDLAAYLNDTNAVCTVFLPTNKAVTDNIRMLGKYAGLAAQNATLASSTLNYHVVPGAALTADDVGAEATRVMTRANQTLYMWREGGQPRIYFRADYPVGLNRTNIRAGKCLVHTIDRSLVPPTAVNQVEAWLNDTGNLPTPRPKGQWAPQQQPLPDSIEAQQLKAAAPAPSAARSSSRVCQWHWPRLAVGLFIAWSAAAEHHMWLL